MPEQQLPPWPPSSRQTPRPRHRLRLADAELWSLERRGRPGGIGWNCWTVLVDGCSLGFRRREEEEEVEEAEEENGQPGQLHPKCWTAKSNRERNGKGKKRSRELKCAIVDTEKSTEVES